MTRGTCPLFRRFTQLVRRDPHAPAILAPDRTPLLSRAALLAPSAALAEELGALSQPGDTAVLSIPNRWESVAAFLAARAAQLRVALVDATAPARERERCAKTVGARLAVTLASAGGGKASLAVPTLALTPRQKEPVPLPAGAAVLKLTSGSTGTPRAVALSVGQVTADTVQIIRTMGLHDDDLTLAAIPLTHSYGFGSCLMPLLLAGIPLVFPTATLPAALLAALTGARVTHFPAVPAMIRALASLSDLPPLPHLRVCLAAGAPLDPADALAFHTRTGVKVHVFYGSSECGGITYDRSPGVIAEKGRVGTPLWRVRVEVVDEGGRPCPPGVEGRVRVTSPAVALGLVPAEGGEPSITGRSFLTADLGWQDAEQNLTLTGRLTAALNVAGKKVHPEEIRRTLEALPGVRGAVVVGLPGPHRGDLVAAVVAVETASGLTTAHLLAHCRAHLAPHKVPHRLVLVDDLPRSERGKVCKEAIFALLQGATPP